MLDGKVAATTQSLASGSEHVEHKTNAEQRHEQLADIGMYGVSAHVLRHLRDELVAKHGKKKYQSMTTTDVCKAFIMRRTASHQCAMMELLCGSGSAMREHVGPATVFVSHAWKYRFATLVETVLAYEQEEALGAYFWIDFFSNNQHKATSYPDEWWVETFGESNIASIGRMLLVMSPWDNPVPTTRAWCLFEIMHAIGRKVQLDIRLPRSEEQAFVAALAADHEAVMTMLVRVQAEEAEAYLATDRPNIVKAVEENIGYTELNARVKEQLRAWCIDQAVRGAEHVGDEQGRDSAAYGDMCVKLGSVLNTFGEHKRALDYYNKALDFRIATFGEQHPSTAAIYNNIAMVHDSQGEYEKALEYHGKDLDITIATLGEQHPSTAATYLNIASVYKSQEEYERALECYDKALSITIATLGEQHPSIAATYLSIANVYKSQKDYEKALEYYGKDLSITIATLGERHPSTVSTYNNMAMMCKSQGEYERALEYYGKALDVTIATFGEQHSSTAATYNNIARLFQSQKEYEKALEYYGKALNIKIATLGEQHPSTATTYNNVASVFQTQEEYARALEYYGKALNIKIATIGEQHPETATIYGNMATVCKSQGEYERALEYFRKALAVKLATLGERHSSTAATQKAIVGLQSLMDHSLLV